MSWSFVQHVHTRHSFDSLADPGAIVRRAAQLGIDVLAVTDHDTWRGSVEAEAEAARAGLPLRVVRASEVHTDHGDLIGLFLSDDIVERNAVAFCEAVHAQGALVVLPHPCKWHRLTDALIAHVDLIEVHNARCALMENEKALHLARTRGMPAVVGPDAHRVGELHLARVQFEGVRPVNPNEVKQALLHAPRQFFVQPGSIWNEWLSQSAKFTRRPSLPLAWGLARGALRRILISGAYRGL